MYQPPSSWIMNHEIQQDGSFYLCTKIDPLFLALPLLERGRKKVNKRNRKDTNGYPRTQASFLSRQMQSLPPSHFCVDFICESVIPSSFPSSNQTADHEGYFLQLDQLLPKSEFPTALIRSGNMLGSKHSIGTLCDVRDGWNEQVVRLNDAKVISWLRSKVERMRHAFKKVESLKHHYTSHELNETPEMEKERIEAERKKKEEESKTDQEEKKESPSNDTTSSAPASSLSTSSSPLSSSSSSTSSSVVSHPTFSAVKQSLAFLSEYLSPATFQLLLDSYALKLDDVFEKKRPIRRDWNENGKISNDIEISRGSSNLNGSETKVRRLHDLSQQKDIRVTPGDAGLL